MTAGVCMNSSVYSACWVACVCIYLRLWPTLCQEDKGRNLNLEFVVFQLFSRVWTPLTLCDPTDSLRPHGLQLTRLPSPSLPPRVCSILHPLSQSYHPTISSSVTPFSSCPQSYQHPSPFQFRIRERKRDAGSSKLKYLPKSLTKQRSSEGPGL